MALLSIIFRVLASLLLWPLAACLAAGLGKLLWVLPYRDGRVIAFFSGVVAYALLQLLFWRPLFMYVMGHELTHALAALLQGGQADDLKVSTKGGMVKVSRSNFIVSLAPYFFPIYTAMVLLVYALAQDRFRIYLVFLLGLTLAFHWALTAYSLKTHQSDIAEVGWFFALPFILALNFVILALVLKAAAPGVVSMSGYLSDSGALLQALALKIKSAF